MVADTTKLIAAGAAGFATAQLFSLFRKRLAATPLPGAKHAPTVFVANEDLASNDNLLACGTLLICTQNLAVSGANQVLLNLVEGHIWRGNVVVLSPTSGPFAKEFTELGASVQVGLLQDLLSRVRDVRLAICNTIMTAHHVVALDAAAIPSMWILHEWWPPEQLVAELTKRNDKNTTPAVVKQALELCPQTVCVCRAQLELYTPTHGAVTFVGVPEPAPNWAVGGGRSPDRVTFLCLGIVCPRKNQHWAVEVFKRWAGDRNDVRLLVVGARYIRQYETDYVNKVKAIIDGDPRIELHDVTNDVDKFYRMSDVLLFTSLNEVTPMVIAESMLRSLPVITTDIAGIPEMLVNGVHGYSLPADQPDPFLQALTELGATDAEGQRRRLQMGATARKHAMETFSNRVMVSQYRAAALALAAPIVLVDMDGVLVDWDAGFRAAWGARSAIDRAKSYFMEDCVPAEFRDAAVRIIHAQGFFAGLPPMAGGVAAVRKLARMGYRVFLCTAPVLTSANCAGEKFEWVRRELGADWVGRVILTTDKTTVRGDVLIDDKPKISGTCHPVWRQLLFSAPYNAQLQTPHRLEAWGGAETGIEALLTSGPAPKDEHDAAKDEHGVSHEAVEALPDFSSLLPADYRKDYAAWRSGRPQGARGELHDAIDNMQQIKDSMLNNAAEDFTEVHVFRHGYSSWRRGAAIGAITKSPAVSRVKSL